MPDRETIPAGWGFLPGIPLDLSTTDLPALPLLRVVRPEDRERVVCEALQQNPAVTRLLTSRDVQQAYPLLNMKAAAHALWGARAAAMPREWRL